MPAMSTQAPHRGGRYRHLSPLHLSGRESYALGCIDGRLEARSLNMSSRRRPESVRDGVARFGRTEGRCVVFLADIGGILKIHRNARDVNSSAAARCVE